MINANPTSGSALTASELSALVSAADAARVRYETVNTKLSEMIAAEKEKYDAATAELRAAMRSNGVDTMSVDVRDAEGNVVYVAEAAITPVDTASVTDWGALYAHIQATGDFHLLHKRLASTPVVEAFQAQTEIPPGTKVEQFKTLKLSIKKPKKSRRAAR